MAISLFIEFEGRELGGPAEIGETLAEIPGVSSVELYTPGTAYDPMLDDGAPPPLVVQLRFPSPAEAGAASGALTSALDEIAMFAGAIRPRAVDVVENHLYPEAGEGDPLTSAVAIAYLVHYRRPAEDEAEFIRYYLAHHPAIMAELPGIRRLEIYTPVVLPGAPALPSGETMLICDVSFDGTGALTAALESDIRLKLRADFKTFPPYSGPVTHFAMSRTRFLP